MTYHTPKYFEEFSCSASACPDSCCRAGWEIPIDPDTYGFYRSAGIDIDANSYIDRDGDRVFKLEANGTCPFFRGDGLCDIYVRTDGRLCEICAKYPRFFEEYDGFAEAGISVSCPTAAEMILSREDNPYIDLKRETPDLLLEFLITARERAMKMIYDEPDPEKALRKLYGYMCDLQDLIDEDELDRINSVAGEPFDIVEGEVSLRKMKQRLLKDTEILTERWRGLLSESGAHNAGTPLQRRNYLAYLVYRYFLKAINTEDISAQGSFITKIYRLAKALGDDYIENVRLISKEIEHNAENYDIVLDIFSGLL